MHDVSEEFLLCRCERHGLPRVPDHRGAHSEIPANLFDLMATGFDVLRIHAGHLRLHELGVSIKDHRHAGIGCARVLLGDPCPQRGVLLFPERTFNRVNAARAHALVVQYSLTGFRGDRQPDCLACDLQRIHPDHAVP